MSSSLVGAKQRGGKEGGNYILSVLNASAQGVAWFGALYLGFEFLKVLRQTVVSLNKDDNAVLIQKGKESLAKRLNKPHLKSMDLNSYEAKIAVDVVSVEELGVSFADIGGMESELDQVRDNVVMPIQFHTMLRGQSELTPCPTGVLLYGRPGTGKTMTAKAVAKEAGATFINIKAGTIMEKWFGESDKLVTALFSLARKLAPAIIFIDEVDTIMKKREDGNGASPALATMHGVFLSEWDGLVSSNNGSSGGSSCNGPVVVLGATNRPQDLDKAFLRRMPVMIKTLAPDARGRCEIFRNQLSKELVDADVSYDELAARTDNYTGSDIREVVRAANVQRMKDMMRGAAAKVAAAAAAAAAEGSAASSSSSSSLSSTENSAPSSGLLPFTKSHFDFAIAQTRPSSSTAQDYASELLLESTQEQIKMQQNVINKLTEQDKKAAEFIVLEVDEETTQVEGKKDGEEEEDQVVEVIDEVKPARRGKNVEEGGVGGKSGGGGGGGGGGRGGRRGRTSE